MRSGRFRVAATFALLAVGVPASAQRATRPLLDLAHAKVVDLSYAFDDRTLYWPTSPTGFQLKVLHHGATPAGFFYAANSFCTPEHGGTHIDAPIHFSATGLTVDRVALLQLVAPLRVIDVADS